MLLIYIIRDLTSEIARRTKHSEDAYTYYNFWIGLHTVSMLSKSYVHEILKKFGRYPAEDDEKAKPKEFLRPPER